MCPSAPAVMSPGPALGRGSGNSVMTPAGVMRPILLALNSENQMLPSGPAARARGPLSGVGMGYSVIDALRRDLADLPAAELPEPDVAVGTEGDGARERVRRRDGELGDHAGRRDAPHPVAGVLRKPEVAVGPEGDDPGRAVGVRERKLGQAGAVRLHAADAIPGAFGKPDGAVLSKGDRGRAAAGVGQRKLGHGAVGRSAEPHPAGASAAAPCSRYRPRGSPKRVSLASTAICAS